MSDPSLLAGLDIGGSKCLPWRSSWTPGTSGPE